MSVDQSLVEEARAALQEALKECAKVVREAHPSIGIEAIKERHKQFDELWPVVIQTVRGSTVTSRLTGRSFKWCEKKIPSF